MPESPELRDVGGWYPQPKILHDVTALNDRHHLDVIALQKVAGEDKGNFAKGFLSLGELLFGEAPRGHIRATLRVAGVRDVVIDEIVDALAGVQLVRKIARFISNNRVRLF